MKVALLGAGNWGTTLAICFARRGHDVALWEHDPEQAELLQSARCNEKFLPGFQIPSDVVISQNLFQTLENREIIFLAVPAQSCREVIKKLSAFINHAILVSLIKGIEQHSLALVSEICAQEISGFDNRNYAVLSGPTIAVEVAAGLPASAVAASRSNDTAQKIQKEFSSKEFRLYRSDDVAGVELGGALKNVIAIAAGICDGMKLGVNAKSALMTRGLAEIAKLGEAMGGNRQTFAGLSGLGDLITTCTSPFSRNRQIGERIGKGERIDEILKSAVMVAEGVWTARAARDLGQKRNLDLPTISAICDILFDGKTMADAVKDLMTRDLKAED